ncbi:MAG: ABC transporter permease [Polyangiaceae bacterium]|nr:ABC transporter permease [Polyangiaceae bacterium]
MLRRIWTFGRKETAEHWAVFVGLFVVAALLALIRWLSSRADPLAPGQLDAAAAVIMVFTPVAALVLGRRLIVREYQQRTVQFLEALPLRRAEFLFAKLVVGWVVLAGLVFGIINALFLASGEPGMMHWLIVLLKSLGYAGVLWSCAFLLGLVGRLRFALYIFVPLVIYLLETTTAFEIMRFGPFALIDPNTFPYERTALPLRALGESAAASSVLVGLAFTLGLIREGAFAERLANRASPREKSALTLSVFLSLLAVSVFEAKQQPPPFEFSSQEVERSRRWDIEVMYGWPELAPQAVSVIRDTERLFQRAEGLIPITFPAVRIVHNSALDQDDVRAVHLEDRGGVLLHVNLGMAGPARAELLYLVAHDAHTQATDDRAAFESQHWVLDGYASWLVASEDAEYEKRSWGRAVAAMKVAGLASDTLIRFEPLMERVGEQGAAALAFAIFRQLVQQVGPQRAVAVARSVVAESRAVWSGNSEFSAVFEATVGKPWADFIGDARAELVRRGKDLDGEAVRLSTSKATLSVRPGTLGSEVFYVVNGGAPKRQIICQLRHKELPPFDLFVPTKDLGSHPVHWPAGAYRVEGRLRGRYGSGVRVLVALECPVQSLGSSVRLAVSRMELP